MPANLVLFNGIDAKGLYSLWVTDGTPADTWEISVPGTPAPGIVVTGGPTSLNPTYLAALGNEVLFAAGNPAQGSTGQSLWITDGTSPDTTEISVPGNPQVRNLVAIGSKALFEGDAKDLWVTDGTSGGTSKLTVNGANTLDGLNPTEITAFNGKALFAGFDSNFHEGLWITDGTSGGTSELTIAMAAPTGIFNFPPSNFAILGSEALFGGADASGQNGLWETDGTSGGTSEIKAGPSPVDLVTLGSKVVFTDAVGGLWITDGTNGGTTEIMTGLGAGPHDLTVFGNKVLFAAGGAFNDNLWVTDGVNTSEIPVAGAGPDGLFVDTIELPFLSNGPFSPGFVVLGNDVLFEGQDANGGLGLWVTDGTSGGTSELPVTGALPTPPNTFPSGLSPTFLTEFTQDLLQPVLSNLPARASYIERGTPATLASSVHPSDSNSPTLASATVSITGGTFTNDGDKLAATTTGTAITALYDPGSETLTLSGTDTVAHYASVLEFVTFSSSSHNPTDYGADPTRTISWQVDDGAVANNLSVPATTTVSITPVNDPPALSFTSASPTFTEEGPRVALLTGAVIDDPDDRNLASATVAITGGTFARDQDVLAVTTTGPNISAIYDQSTETLTLIGTDTLAHYETMLDSITFLAGENPTNFGLDPTRSITWTLTDPGDTLNGGNNVGSVTTSVNVVKVNDPPTLTGVAGLAKASGSQTVTLSPTLGISDPDDLTLAGATVSITGGTFVGDGDVLAASTAGTAIGANYSSATETLTLTGIDTLAHYAQVLDSVTFHSTGANLTNSGTNRTRTVTWTVDDGSSANNLSTPATTTISLLQPAVPFDLNGDGNSDFVLRNNGQVGVWLMNGTTPIAETGLGNPGASWRIVTSRDMNGDGNADLIWQNSDGTPGIWLMNGTTPVAEAAFSSPGAFWHLVTAGDVNGDGNGDVVWQGNDGTLGVWLMNGTTPQAEAAIGNPGSNWKAVGTADYNADGRDDILLQDTATGNLMIDLMNGTSIASTVSISVGDPSWHAVSTGEFNGQAEIAWQNSNGTPAIWLMNGTAPVAEAALPNPGAGWQLLSIDHFTPNGQADLLFQNTNGAMQMWEMNGPGIAAEVALPSSGGWQLVNGHPFTSS